jgi:hypothetical protein
MAALLSVVVPPRPVRQHTACIRKQYRGAAHRSTGFRPISADECHLSDGEPFRRSGTDNHSEDRLWGRGWTRLGCLEPLDRFHLPLRRNCDPHDHRHEARRLGRHARARAETPGPWHDSDGVGLVSLRSDGPRGRRSPPGSPRERRPPPPDRPRRGPSIGSRPARTPCHSPS